MPDKSPAIIALDRDDLTLDCATKACAGDGVKTLRRWLDDGKADVLILHNGRGEPLVLLSGGTWNRVARTIARSCRTFPSNLANRGEALLKATGSAALGAPALHSRIYRPPQRVFWT